MSYEELLICEHALRKRGWRFFWYFGNERYGYTLRARKYPPRSWQGWREQVIELREAADLHRYLHP
jgi:hypothetical protein